MQLFSGHFHNYTQSEISEWKRSCKLSSSSAKFLFPLILLASTARKRAHLRGLLEGGADGTNLDVGINDGGAGRVGLDVVGLAAVGSARSTGNTRGRGVLVGGVGGVEPQHVHRVVVPQGHDKDVALGKGGTHLLEATTVLERRVVAECRLLCIAESISNGVTRHTLDGRVGVLEDLAVLYIEALDLLEVGSGTNELSDDRHLLVGVERHSRTVEVLNTHAVGLKTN